MYVYGRQFQIATDTKPLKYIFGPMTANPVLAAQRFQLWAIELAAYDYELRFITPEQNILTDALSGLPITESSA